MNITHSSTRDLFRVFESFYLALRDVKDSNDPLTPTPVKNIFGQSDLRYMRSGTLQQVRRMDQAMKERMPDISLLPTPTGLAELVDLFHTQARNQAKISGVFDPSALPEQDAIASIHNACSKWRENSKPPAKNLQLNELDAKVRDALTRVESGLDALQHVPLTLKHPDGSLIHLALPNISIRLAPTGDDFMERQTKFATALFSLGFARTSVVDSEALPPSLLTFNRAHLGAQRQVSDATAAIIEHVEEGLKESGYSNEAINNILQANGAGIDRNRLSQSIQSNTHLLKLAKLYREIKYEKTFEPDGFSAMLGLIGDSGSIDPQQLTEEQLTLLASAIPKNDISFATRLQYESPTDALVSCSESSFASLREAAALAAHYQAHHVSNARGAKL